ncbi:unnamed protein product, partial [Sphenostylis stenocarpa]
VIESKFKLSLDDPDASLSSWNSRDATPCNWYGVTCAGDTSNTTVTAFDLSDTNIGGPFLTNILCRLPNLLSINLLNNSINQTLPLDISLCRNLRHLDLSQNLLTGLLPATLPLLPNLRHLDLSRSSPTSRFSGPIPDSFGTFQNLQVLSLVSNLLEGTIPPSLGNVSSLKMLNLSYNPFFPGWIPPELGNFTNLEVLWLTQCNLVGVIPTSLGNLNKLQDLNLALVINIRVRKTWDS